MEGLAIGRLVDAVPPVREEGDATLIPVVEEVVVEGRLALKEEIHLRRVRTTQRHQKTSFRASGRVSLNGPSQTLGRASRSPTSR